MLTAPGRTAIVANLGAGRSAALLTYRSTDPGGDLADGPHPALTRAYRDSGWLLPELLDQLDQVESVYFDSTTQVRADHWSRGRVVLLGDAAWCLTLFAATPPNAPRTAAGEPGRMTSSCARPRCRRSPGSSSGSSGSTDDPGQAAVPGSPCSSAR
jgi:hypothetical protein